MDMEKDLSCKVGQRARITMKRENEWESGSRRREEKKEIEIKQMEGSGIRGV